MVYIFSSDWFVNKSEIALKWKGERNSFEKCPQVMEHHPLLEIFGVSVETSIPALTTRPEKERFNHDR